jgi:hypothetical protein
MEDDALPPQRTQHQEAWAETRPPQHNDIAAAAGASVARPFRTPGAAAAHGAAEAQATPPATPPGSSMLSAPPSAACSEAATQLAAVGSNESAGSTSAAVTHAVCSHR